MLAKLLMCSRVVVNCLRERERTLSFFKDNSIPSLKSPLIYSRIKLTKRHGFRKRLLKIGVYSPLSHASFEWQLGCCYGNSAAVALAYTRIM